MKSMRIFLTIFVCAVLMSVTYGGVAYADRGDQDRARAALLRGEVEPLSKALTVIEQNFEGDVIEVELEEDDKFAGGERLIYEVKVLTPTGLVMKVKLDAKTLEILSHRVKDGDH